MFLGIQFSKKEIIWAAFFILLITLATSLPYLYGFTVDKPDLTYLGVNLFNKEDVPTYLTWTKQALDGQIFFKQLYAPEAQPTIFFHPLFLLAGLVGKLLHFPLILTYMGLRVLTTLFFVACAYLFSSYFFTDRWQRLYSLGLISLGTGLSNIFGPASADYTQIEFNNFATLTSTVLAPMGMGLIMISVLLFLQYKMLTRKTFLVIFAVLVNTLILIHPYDYLPLVVVLTAYALFLGVIKKNWETFRLLLYGILLSFPAILWQTYVIHENVPIALWALFQANVSSTGLLSYILGMGVGLVFALIGVVFVNIEKREKYYILAIWLLMSLAMLFNPISERFQRKLSIGITIPLAILAVNGIYNLMTDFRIKNKIIVPKKYVLIVIFYLIIASNINLLVSHIRAISASNSRPYFMSTDEIDGMKWIENNVGPDRIVLSTPELGLYIPALAGRTVDVAKIDQNTFYMEKYQTVYNVLLSTPSFADPLQHYVKMNSISHVIISSEINDYFAFDTSNRPYLKEVFANEDIQIYEVN